MQAIIGLRLRWAVLLNPNIFLHIQTADLRQLMLNPNVRIRAAPLLRHAVDMVFIKISMEQADCELLWQPLRSYRAVDQNTDMAGESVAGKDWCKIRIQLSPANLRYVFFLTPSERNRAGQGTKRTRTRTPSIPKLLTEPPLSERTTLETHLKYFTSVRLERDL